MYDTCNRLYTDVIYCDYHALSYIETRCLLKIQPGKWINMNVKYADNIKYIYNNNMNGYAMVLLHIIMFCVCASCQWVPHKKKVLFYNMFISFLMQWQCFRLIYSNHQSMSNKPIRQAVYWCCCWYNNT